MGGRAVAEPQRAPEQRLPAHRYRLEPERVGAVRARRAVPRQLRLGRFSARPLSAASSAVLSEADGPGAAAHATKTSSRERCHRCSILAREIRGDRSGDRLPGEGLVVGVAGARVDLEADGAGHRGRCADRCRPDRGRARAPAPGSGSAISSGSSVGTYEASSPVCLVRVAVVDRAPSRSRSRRPPRRWCARGRPCLRHTPGTAPGTSGSPRGARGPATSSSCTIERSLEIDL